MNRIEQYRPNFFTGYKPEVVDFDGVDALLKIPFVANFKTALPNFHQFSITKLHTAPERPAVMLIAEYEGGAVWWVAGHMMGPVDLPTWDSEAAKRKRRLMAGSEGVEPST